MPSLQGAAVQHATLHPVATNKIQQPDCDQNKDPLSGSVLSHLDDDYIGRLHTPGLYSPTVPGKVVDGHVDWPHGLHSPQLMKPELTSKAVRVIACLSVQLVASITAKTAQRCNSSVALSR